MIFLRWFAALCGVLGVVAPLWATTVVPPDFSQLVNESDYVVRARVTAVTAERVTREGRPAIFTRIELEILEIIAGNPPARPVLVMLGGRIGDDEMWVEGAPRFAVGDEDVLFVVGNGRYLHPLYALGHGRYRIARDAAGREFVTRSNGVPLEDVAEISLPLSDGSAATLQRRARTGATALAPAQFAASIRALRQPAARREK
ncbi:MAG: hypothetical protein C0518_12340 [Opitutus sp.]|nr:hypothetical protein [Opitutus sp.]